MPEQETVEATVEYGVRGSDLKRVVKLLADGQTKARNVDLGSKRLDPSVIAALDDASGAQVDVTVMGKVTDSQALIVLRGASVVTSKPFRIGDYSPSTDAFLNPYNFVPPWRATVDPFGDRDGPAQAYRAEGAVSGRLTVRLKTISPLLTLDDVTATFDSTTGSAESDGSQRTSPPHGTYGIRRDPRSSDGSMPLLPATSFKGALRSIYEAVTGSRFGVWSQELNHPLAYREPAQGGASAVRVARVVDLNDSGAVLQCWNAPGSERAVPTKLPMYGVQQGGKPKAGALITVQETGQAPKHGEKYWANLRPLVQRSERGAGSGKNNAVGWVVVALSKDESKLPRLNVGQERAQGFAVITGRSILSKRYERFAWGTAERIEIDSQAVGDYNVILAAYHSSDRSPQSRAVYKNGASPGIHVGQGATPPRLQTGDWVLVREGQKGKKEIVPVAIGRAVWDVSPRDLASEQRILPAINPSEMSTADRVFGWVGDGSMGPGDAARRGRLRVSDVRCIGGPDSAVEAFDEPLVLHNMSAPKPAQGRFYAAGNTTGDPLEDGSKKSDLFHEGGGLRGRKFYWHHRAVVQEPQYWDVSERASVPTKTSSGLYREFMSPTQIGSGQNRSIREWVPIGVEFEVDIYVEGLELAEFGALLWCLMSPEQIPASLKVDVPGILRVGYGKPLGFGSVSTEIDMTRSVLTQRSDEPARQRWESWNSGESDLDNTVIGTALGTFIDALGAEGRRVAKTVGRLLRGIAEMPVHYPRSSSEPGEESYKWFVENEAKGKVSLPTADPDHNSAPSFPYTR